MLRIRTTLVVCFSSALITLAATAATSQEPASGGDRFISRSRQLTLAGRRAGEGYFSPDGKKMIFQSERYRDNPFFQIYTMDLETGRIRLISPGVGRTTCSFFRASTDEVLFASTHLDPNARAVQKQELADRDSGTKPHVPWVYDEYYDIFSCDQRGRRMRQLTDTWGYDAEGAYSPDGKKIAFTTLRDAYPLDNLDDKHKKIWEEQPSYFAEIYIMDADGSNQQRLTDWPGYDGGPFFTSDGERIIWRHFEADGVTADIYTMKTDGSDRRRLTDFGSMSWAPYMHPSGEYAIFASNKLGFANFELFIVDAMGEKEPVRVTYTDGFDGLPVFLPDGQQLTWTTSRNAKERYTAQIHMGDWDHKAALAAVKGAPPRGTPEKFEEVDRVAASSWADPRLPTPSTKTSSAMTKEDLYSHVRFLASDELEGRMTGSTGVRKAGDYIAAAFKEAGLEGLGDDGSFFQAFKFPAGVVSDAKACALTIREGTGADVACDIEVDYRPLTFSADGEVDAEVVFAGYGLVVPAEVGEKPYDSYEGLDVAGKVVLILDDVPAKIGTEKRIHYALHGGPRYKAMEAARRGAKGVLMVVGPSTAGSGELPPPGDSDSSLGIVAASISLEVADKLVAGSGWSVGSLQASLDSGDIPNHLAKLAIKSRVMLKTSLIREQGICRNVVGLLPSLSDGPLSEEFVVVGAHYDHIGFGGTDSLAHAGEEGLIHNGADDNASGTAVVLELMAMLAERYKDGDSQRDRRNVIFACWSGEEIGVIGSTHFARHAPCPLGQISSYINFDMVGRLRDGKLMIQALGSSKDWPALIEQMGVRVPLDLVLQDEPYLPTDTHEFYPAGIPVLSFFTGVHGDYNRPTDDADTLNYEGMERIACFAGNLIDELSHRPSRLTYSQVKQSAPAKGSKHGNRRIYTGTIPDFTAGAIKGMKISGVRGGSPAEKAGLVGGDVIVRLAGREINSLQDYATVLRALRAGEAVEVVVIRGTDELRLTMIPSVRE